jgi:methyl-accepting chemotaxis protein
MEVCIQASIGLSAALIMWGKIKQQIADFQEDIREIKDTAKERVKYLNDRIDSLDEHGSRALIAVKTDVDTLKANVELVRGLDIKLDAVAKTIQETSNRTQSFLERLAAIEGALKAMGKG